MPPINSSKSNVNSAIFAAYEFTRSPLTLAASILAFLVKITKETPPPQFEYMSYTKYSEFQFWH